MSEISARESKGLEEEPTGNEADLTPEYCQYRDEGCELADSCLNCPFPQCIYDEPRGRQHLFKKLRDGEIVKLFISEGKEVKELALMFGLSRRTVQRALKNSLSTSLSRSGWDGSSGGSANELCLFSSTLCLNKTEESGRRNALSKGELIGNE
ncbi:hypothetical protein ACFLUZ_04735 [Chloroflexota bacterium]